MAAYKQNIAVIINELTASLAGVDHAGADGVIEKILRCSSVFIGGAGRSGLLMRCFAMRLMQLGFACHVVGDTVTPSISPQDLLIVGSGSGETSCLAVICKKAREKGAAITLITANTESTCSQFADTVIKIPVPTPKAQGAIYTASSLQPLGCLFEQAMFIFLEAMIMKLMTATGKSNNDMITRHANLE